MKKNRLFVLGLVTVFVALVSLTFVSSTWAKYTTTRSGSDQARVAYWGFDEGDKITLNLFSTAYGNDVKSNDSNKVIAPGTAQSATLTFVYDGDAKPEVDYVLSFNVDATSEINTLIKENDNIQWRAYIKGTSESSKPAFGTWQNMVDAINSYTIKGEASEVQPSELLVIEWQWLFVDDFTTNQDETAMGNSTSNLKVKLVINVTASQVNE